MKDISNEMEDLILTYLSEGLTREDAARLEQWILASEENRRLFASRQEVWLAAHPADRSRFDSEEAYGRFRVRTGVSALPGGKRRLTLRTFWYGAAAIALLIVVSTLSYWQGTEGMKTRFTDITVEAPLGSQTKMYLPDGSHVWLNAGSTICYSQGFGVEDRHVRLTGEGYFEVMPNGKLPFTVATDEISTEVLGTTFNFCNYSDEREATISLVEGKVRVSNRLKEERPVELMPDQKVCLNKCTGELLVSRTNAANSAEWTNGNLFFDETVLPDIIKVLERSYDVSITLADDSLSTFRFYGSFDKHDCHIEDILDMLGSTGKLRYEINGKNIELSAK